MVAWAALKWLITCSLIAIVVFQRTIHASIHRLLEPTHQNANSKPAAMDPRPSNIHDIYHTVFLLQQKLVRDVIPAIIEYAELYECTTIEDRFYPSQQISQYQAPKQLLVCELPKPTARVLRSVRKSSSASHPTTKASPVTATEGAGPGSPHRNYPLLPKTASLSQLTPLRHLRPMTSTERSSKTL